MTDYLYYNQHEVAEISKEKAASKPRPRVSCGVCWQVSAGRRIQASTMLNSSLPMNYGKTVCVCIIIAMYLCCSVVGALWSRGGIFVVCFSMNGRSSLQTTAVAASAVAIAITSCHGYPSLLLLLLLLWARGRKWSGLYAAGEGLLLRHRLVRPGLFTWSRTGLRCVSKHLPAVSGFPCGFTAGNASPCVKRADCLRVFFEFRPKRIRLKAL